MKPLPKSLQIFFFAFVPIIGLAGLLVAGGFWSILFFIVASSPLIVGGGAIVRSKFFE